MHSGTSAWILNNKLYEARRNNTHTWEQVVGGGEGKDRTKMTNLKSVKVNFLLHTNRDVFYWLSFISFNFVVIFLEVKY